jgi:RNA polymerase sigma factor (sigma-70 family)
VASNKCSDYYRRTTRKPTVPLDLLIENIYEEDERAPDKIAMRQEEYRLLHKHLAVLTEQQKEVLRLKFGHNLRSPEIARRLNKSESAVRMMLARTLNALRDIYTSNGERRER